MNRNCLFNKALALLLCAVLVLGCVPSIALPAAADTNDWESDIDVVETTTEEPTEPPLGSEDNPIFLSAQENSVDNTGTMYYYGNFSGMTMTVTGEGEFSVIYNGETVAAVDGVVSMSVSSSNPRMPVNFAIVGDGTYQVNFAYPEGHQMNPVALTLGYNDVSLAEGNTGAYYYYTWTAEATGDLTFEISSITEGVEADIIISNNTSYAQKSLTADGVEDAFGAMVVTMPVTAGDEIAVQVIALPDENYNYPAAEITHYSAFVYPLGSEQNPILLTAQENTVTNAGTLYYQGYFSGMTMTVTGEGDFSVIYNGETVAAVDGVVSMPVSSTNPRMPVNFAVVGDGEYSIDFAYPTGHQMNPVALTLGYNDVSLAEGNTGAYYYYTWTAEATGDLTFEISSITEGVEADIIISNNTSYAQKTLTADGVEDAFGAMVVTMPVTAGDEITVQVVTLPDANWNYPAADITHYSAFVYPLGSEQNPILLNAQENTVTNAGTVYYQGYFSGMIMTVSGEGDFSVIYNGETVAAVDGVVSMPVSSANPRMPVIFAVVGDGEYSINFAYPAGHQMNPAVAVLGDNAASIEAGNTQGYFWTYTAEKAGNLIVTISADAGWTYTVNNMTTGSYGDTQLSDSDPVVNPTTITVAEGDEIQIIVNTYDPADTWNNPAGDITVNLAYKAEEHVCEHVAEVVGLSQTKGESGQIVYTCECGDTYSVDLPSGDNQLRFAAISLALGADLTVNFAIKSSIFAEGNFENVYMVFQIEDENGNLSDPVTVSEWEDYNHATNVQFPFKGVASRMMNDVIHATVYGTYNGVECSVPYTYKATTYCYSQLRKSASGQVLKNLIVDLLNFGTEHQKYMSYNLDNLINADLTDEEKAYAGSYDLEAEKIQNTSYAVIDNPTAAFKGIGLFLSNAVIVRYKVNLTDLEGVVLRVEVDGVVTEIPASEFVDNSNPEFANDLADGQYYIFCSAAKARQMRTDILATLYKNGEPISNTFQYQIQSYVYGRETHATMGEMLKAMLYYGDSAKAYLG